MATSVQGMRLRDLNRYNNKTLWKVNDLVNEVCRLVETENDKKHRRYARKIPDLFYNGVAQASPRLENLVYVLCGHDMPAIHPLTGLTSLRKDWLYIIETRVQAEVHSLVMEQTKDLSLNELPQFSKSPDMKSIQGIPQTPRTQQLREHLEQLRRPSARTSRT